MIYVVARVDSGSRSLASSPGYAGREPAGFRWRAEQPVDSNPIHPARGSVYQVQPASPPSGSSRPYPSADVSSPDSSSAGTPVANRVVEARRVLPGIRRRSWHRYSTATVRDAASSSLLDRLERDQDNLRAALRFWIELPDAEQGARQAAGLFPIWFFRGSVAEGRAWLDELLSLPLARATPEVQKRVLPMAANLARRHGEYTAACDLFEELLAACEAAGDRPGAAATLLDLANVHEIRADYPAARAALEASRTRSGESDDLSYQAAWLFVGGLIELHDGQYDVARNLLTKGLACSERMASATGVQPAALYRGYVLLGLAAVARQQGEDTEAGALVDQGFPDSRHPARQTEALAILLARRLLISGVRYRTLDQRIKLRQVFGARLRRAGPTCSRSRTTRHRLADGP